MRIGFSSVDQAASLSDNFKEYLAKTMPVVILESKRYTNGKT
jgi:hypothetical protein